MKRIWGLFKFFFFTGLLILFYAFFCEPYMLKTTPYMLENKALSGLKIVFATDFHVAPYPWEKWRLKRVVHKINKENPDLVLLGGDYVKGHEQQSSLPPYQIAQELQKINAPKVAVLGNHDSYYGKKDVAKALKDAGIFVLDNQNIRLRVRDRWVTIAGVSDYSTDKPDVMKALQGAGGSVIFITHSPDVMPQIQGRIIVAFAGHTHGGQIVLPFVGAPLIPSDYGQRYRYGLINERGLPLVVSSGLGTSLVPLRFNIRPEIVAVTFDNFFEKSVRIK